MCGIILVDLLVEVYKPNREHNPSNNGKDKQ